MEAFAALIAATLAAGTPLLLAGLGLLVNERAGVLNLGAEGTMLMSAVAGFASKFQATATGGSAPTPEEQAAAESSIVDSTRTLPEEDIQRPEEDA